MYRTWSISYRPRAGITDRQIADLHHWAKTRSDFYLLGVEKSGTERHAHLGIYLPRASNKANICNRLLSVPALRLDVDETRVMRKGVKIMYNTDWVMGYVGDDDKGDEYTEVGRRLPDDLTDLETYYPAPDDQQSIKPLSIWYAKIEKLWLEHPQGRANYNRDPSAQILMDFMSYLMNDARIIEVISDPRIFKQKAEALCRFIRKFRGVPTEQPGTLPCM